jgi:MarR family transcriptional regulator, organic hydroperoxide resistance regulator
MISESGLSDPVLALQRATHRTLHALSTALADLNLSAAEINALANLGDGGSLNVRQLSERTGTRASTLTGLLDRLENRGYLTRELDPGDRRSFRLPLTETGQAAATRVLTAIADLERAALSRLSAEQIAGYHAVITALQEAS